jgi:hypothetical protein
LTKKAERIEMKQKAIMKYEHFLEKVQQGSDEFLEIADILSRHKTLVDENRKLDTLN